MDTVAGPLFAAHDLYARAANATTPAAPSADKPTSYKIIGLVLAIASGLFIGVSFVLKKHGLLAANVKYNEEAGEGYGYLKNVWWWTGMTLMILGEICNFAAYLFADAILVTPLGALSVVVCAILSSIFLKERLSFVGKVGCFQCIVGAVVIAANAPEQSAVNNIQDMKRLVISPGFLSFAGVIILGCAFVAFWAGPRYGKKTMLVYITICSLIGGLSVVCIQGIGAAITAQARAPSGQFKEWFFYVLLVFVIATLVTEIIFLNKALNLYNAALVTPTYYVYFTSATIVSSAVLFRGFKGTPIQILTVVLGFFIICSGVVLLQLSKSAKDVPDTAVFKGDLDQVRTVAEQEEPEYEPRADSIRAGGALLRALSTSRHSRELGEIRRIKDEHLSMSSIGEHEQVEFDGLRRRRTVLLPSHAPNAPSPLSQMQRRRSVHPPLGMSRFPNEDEHNSDDDVHPGFLDHFRRKRVSSSKPLPRPPTGEQVAMSPITAHSSSLSESSDPTSTAQPHVFGLPPSLQHHQYADTSYKSPASPGIRWVSGDRPPSHATNDISPPPTVPTHGARRQFSFQDVFRRPGSRGQATENAARPASRGLSKSAWKAGAATRTDGATEEERMGLVKGDSHTTVPRNEPPPGYSDPEEDWQHTRESPPMATPLDVHRTSLPQYHASTDPRPRSGTGRRRRDTESSQGSNRSNRSDPSHPANSTDGPAFV